MTRVRALDPRVGAALAAATAVIAALLPKYEYERLVAILGAEAVCAVAAVLGGKIDISRWFLYVTAGAASAALFGIFTIFRPGHALFTPVAGWTVSAEGVVFAGGLMLSAAASAGALGLFVVATPGPQARAAFSALGAPATAIAIVTVMARRIREFSSAIARMRVAAAARGGRSTGRLAFLARRGTVARLFVQSLEDGVRLDRALAARGFRGGFPAQPLPPMDLLQYGAAALGGALLSCIALLP